MVAGARGRATVPKPQGFGTSVRAGKDRPFEEMVAQQDPLTGRLCESPGFRCCPSSGVEFVISRVGGRYWLAATDRRHRASARRRLPRGDQVATPARSNLDALLLGPTQDVVADLIGGHPPRKHEPTPGGRAIVCAAPCARNLASRLHRALGIHAFTGSSALPLSHATTPCAAFRGRLCEPFPQERGH